MKSKLIARHKKQATVLVSKQTLEQVVREGQQLAERLMAENSNDSQLDQIQQAVAGLTSILSKTPSDMQADGASTLEDYLDDAVLPEMAKKIKQDIDMIANARNTSRTSATPAAAPSTEPVMAAMDDAFVTDRENGKPKTPEVVEVPRVAAAKKAAPPTAAPVAPAPAAAPAPTMNAEEAIQQLSSEGLAKAVKALTAIKEFESDRAAQTLIEIMTAELKTRPIESKEEKAQAAPAAGAMPAAAPAAPGALPVAASLLGGLRLASAEKTASPTSGGGDWTAGGDRGSVIEDGGRTPEIGQAHKEVDDKTGIKHPATENLGKFAADMTTAKAVKLAERMGDSLKGLYLEAKPLTDANDTRPVREAVESIYRAHDMFGEAIKTLGKQQMAEEAEKAAMAAKQAPAKKASSKLFGLSIATAE